MKEPAEMTIKQLLAELETAVRNVTILDHVALVLEVDSFMARQRQNSLLVAEAARAEIERRARGE